MALWSNKTVQVPGLTATYASSGPITAETRRHYILDTTTGAITVNLPSGIDGYTIRISDAKGTFQTNKVTVAPATGQKINNLAVNETLVLDANEMWIELTWNAIAGSWIVNAPGVLGLITSSYTDYPYITSPSAPATSNLRLYAKSDGKLYVKDALGAENKVGGGLDHPTTNSTFEGGTANPGMSGGSNTAIGVNAGVNIITGNSNTLFGSNAGYSISNNSFNTFIGAISGYYSTGIRNTFVGRNSGGNIGAGDYNTLVGQSAGSALITGSNNTLLGGAAYTYVTDGTGNVVIGHFAGSGLTAASYSYNTIINSDGAASAQTVGYNGAVVIGRDNVGTSSIASADNQFVLGTPNHLYRFPGVAQTALVLGPTGTSTGQTGTLQLRELAANGVHTVSLRAADAITADVTFTLPSSAGTNGQALITNGSGVLSWSTILGLVHPTTGSTFEVNGNSPSISGIANTGLGVGALAAITSGSENTAIGNNALAAATTATYSIAIGNEALKASTSSNSNIAIGSYALFKASSALYTIAIGVEAGYETTTGTGNVFIGQSAGRFTTTGANNIAIGFNTGVSTSTRTISGTVAIGRDSSSNSATATENNQFILGTSNHLYRFPGVAQTSLVLGPTGTSAGQTGTLSFRELAANGTNAITLRAPDNIAADVTFTLPSADGTNGQFLTTNGSGTLSWTTVNTSNSTVTITQNSHGFVAADIGRPVYLNGSTYAFAQADTEAKAEVAGLINSIIDTNTFTLCLAGEVSSVGANLIVGGGSLVAGEMYFLSATVAGRITVTPPSVVGQISKPIGIARSTTAFDFFNMRGSSVGGSNTYTQITLANNATTTIQNVSAYDSVELQGWIFLNATAKYRYLFKAQVTKKGDGTDYLVSFQHSGDTPPDGFNITVTAVGLVQVTLPNLAGFSSAVAQFSLNGPAVGASLPLQINSSLITVNAGIQFPATMVPSTDPNNLDDYEEGVWAPSLYGSSTAGTWTPNATQTGGYYIKIGKLVYLFINLNGSLSGAAGDLLIGNLPFSRSTPNAANGWNASYSAFTMAYGNGLTWTAGHYCSGWLIHPSNYLYGHTMPTGGGTAGVVPVTNGSVNIHITGAYYTN